MASKRKDRLACGVAIATLLPVTAAAQPRSINIPSEEAAKSIPEFARQENIQIVAPVIQQYGDDVSVETQRRQGKVQVSVVFSR